jgi:CMP-N-acetylneuraminic acid synthetase
MNEINVVAFIPARRNSKGILFKNRQKILGESLVEHTFNFAKKCNFDEIIISTDDEYFLEHKHLGRYCHPRNEKLARDESIVADVIQEYSFDKKRKKDFFVVLEPTCFIRQKQHLDFLFDGAFFANNGTTFASFVKSPVIREKIWTFESGRIVAGDDVWKRRQEYQSQYVLSGHYYGLYISKINDMYPALCDNNVYPVMISNDLSIDIDTQNDLDFARFFLAEKL